MRTRTWVVVGMALGLGGSANGQPASGQPAPKQDLHRAAKGKNAKVKPIDLAPLVTALASENPEEAAKAADALGAETDPAAHDALLDALALGLPTPVAVPAIEALALHPAPPDVASLRRYAGHRNPLVRGAAFGALAMYPDPVAHAAVIVGLHDSVGMVRAAAATAAAKSHVREALPPLFDLLGRGEESAARALAQMADPDLARRIGDQLGTVPDAILAQCLGMVLKRADFGPDPARVDVVRALAKIQDPAAISVLTDYLDAAPKNPPRPSRAEAQKLVEQRMGGGK